MHNPFGDYGWHKAAEQVAYQYQAEAIASALNNTTQ
jgi:hypothetical protein